MSAYLGEERKNLRRLWGESKKENVGRMFGVRNDKERPRQVPGKTHEIRPNEMKK